MKRRSWLALFFGGVFSAQVAANCAANVDFSGASEHFSLGFVIEPKPLVTGQVFTLELAVCNHDGTAFNGHILPSAVMPAHQHGMNYQPTVSKLAPGQYRAEGYLFHMPGAWQFQFRLNENDRYETIAIDYLL